MMTTSPASGFRLQRLELYNWGTFHQRIWTMMLHGDTALLTGANGSGKSTVVDALLTLLVPNRKRNYNQAAGEGRRERDELSYMRGAYGKVQHQGEYSAKTQYLRDESSYSVLLAHFHNAGYRKDVTLAQVFWQSNSVQKFFVVAERPLSIAEHFGSVESTKALRAQLRALKAVELFDSFDKYSRRFRKLLGVRSDKALDLFNQTVTIKEIGALNDFVRTHMLEATDAPAQIANLHSHYDDLMLTYGAMQKAERQLALLRPVSEEGERYERTQQEISELKGCEAAIPVYFAGRKMQLLTTEIERNRRESEKQKARKATLDTEHVALNEQRDSLKAAIATDEVGARLRELEDELRRLSNTQNQRRAEARKYDELARLVQMAGLSTHEAFVAARRAAEQRSATLRDEAQRYTDQRDGLVIALEKLDGQIATEAAELASLRQRTTQIPDANLRVRQRLLDALGVREVEMPFIGELLRVNEREQRWEGAIERLMHGFALCLLVPEVHYPRVSRYVNETNLQGRLVFYRIPADYRAAPRTDPEADSLVHKLVIKPDSSFYDWLRGQLSDRFDYTCCETMETFQRASHAITPQGLIKNRREQHEKDDRRALGDRRDFVLGWDNQDKIRAVTRRFDELKTEQRHQTDERNRIDAQIRAAQTERERLADLLRFDDFERLDWQTPHQQAEALRQEQQRLTASSDRLQQLQQELKGIEEKRDKNRKEERAVSDKLAQLGILIDQHTKGIADCQIELRGADNAAMQRYAPRIQERIEGEITFTSVDRQRDQVARGFREESDRAEKRLSSYLGRLMRTMQAYKEQFPTESRDFDASPEAIPDFRRELARIERDDLPTYTERFKGMMDEKIIHHISMLRADLEKYEQQVRESVANLNQSLHHIDYTPDTFIELKTEANHDPEIRDFRALLRDCLTDVGQQQDASAYERSFGKIQQLIKRLKEEARWTQKVTDVRYWLNFAAVERFRSDGSEKHYYSDSSGKSGGQKAKLAFTILASAIAFQFGLEIGKPLSNSLRFVAIDEAFSRSDESNARYAMRLFEELGLQLLVVTPMTGTHIVEPFISTCHFVWNNAEGNHSQVASMSQAEFAERRRDFHEAKRANAAAD